MSHFEPDFSIGLQFACLNCLYTAFRRRCSRCFDSVEDSSRATSREVFCCFCTTAGIRLYIHVVLFSCTSSLVSSLFCGFPRHSAGQTSSQKSRYTRTLWNYQRPRILLDYRFYYLFSKTSLARFGKDFHLVCFWMEGNCALQVQIEHITLFWTGGEVPQDEQFYFFRKGFDLFLVDVLFSRPLEKQMDSALFFGFSLSRIGSTTALQEWIFLGTLSS